MCVKPVLIYSSILTLEYSRYEKQPVEIPPTFVLSRPSILDHIFKRSSRNFGDANIFYHSFW